MILPTKNISPDRALLTLAGKVFEGLAAPKTVSGLWDDFREQQQARPISYAFFILAVDLLYLMKLVTLYDYCLIQRRTGGE